MTSSFLERWFESRGWTPFDFQREAWEAYLAGESGIVHAPTGTGKTLALWGGPLLESVDDPPGPGAYLWITPLRALAADTTRNLNAPIEADWSVETRTGDTSASIRARHRRKPPPALVTTPESLALMVSYADADRRLSRLKAVFIDEWHELVGNKRGVLLQLCLARLRALNPRLRIWGSSATLGNLDEAMQALLGPTRAGRLIRGLVPKRIEIESLRPASIERFPWAGHLGIKLLPQVLERLSNAQTTLLFTNTRNQAELWFQAIQSCAAGWAERVELHHGSIDRALRQSTETRLAAGELRCVVATSSLDLGIDFSPVDQVIQVGSPKGIARLMQRAGRSGHQPGAVSRVLCVPTNALELIEVAAARRAVRDGSIEPRQVPLQCLDVLAQFLVTRALGGGFRKAELLPEIRDTYSYRTLSEAQLDWAVAFVEHGGDTLQTYPAYHKIVCENGVCRGASKRIGTLHRMSIGTITSDSAIAVRWVRGGMLGLVEESFIARLKPGDRFQFAGRNLELVRVRDMAAQVRLARGTRPNTVPRWLGGRLPLSTELADAVLEILEDARTASDLGPELATVRELLELQCERSELPGPGRLIAETATSREGSHLFIYPFAGRLVHEGLAALVAYRFGRLRPASFTLSANDYGFELASPKPFEVTESLLRRALDTTSLMEDMLAAMNASEMARRKFRDIARIAGLVFQGYPGQAKTARQIQASSGLIYDVLCRFDAGNPLLAQARQEVLEGELEFRRMREALEQIESMALVLTHTERLTPLAFPLWADRLRHSLSSEDWAARVRRAARALERAS
ncbi:MAG: ligase-associated DNA damage response DEXH box helicase [Xanthomonadales bacterium]|nr:ligase-associated DNA damage response DEXH box helicase [Xanthomonadales bacterium]